MIIEKAQITENLVVGYEANPTRNNGYIFFAYNGNVDDYNNWDDVTRNYKATGTYNVDSDEAINMFESLIETSIINEGKKVIEIIKSFREGVDLFYQ